MTVQTTLLFPLYVVCLPSFDWGGPHTSPAPKYADFDDFSLQPASAMKLKSSSDSENLTFNLQRVYIMLHSLCILGFLQILQVIAA